MQSAYDANDPKRPANLAEVVEGLLAEHLSDRQAQEAARAEALRAAITTWNTFGDKHGCIADEHSTLWMAQLDDHRNRGTNRRAIPYVAVVQSAIFDD